MVLLCPSCKFQGRISDAVSGVEEKAGEARAKLRGELPPSDSVTVRVIPASSSSAESSCTYVGSVEPVKEALLSCQYPGKLVTLCVRQGQKVYAGAKIAEVSSASVKGAYDMAAATLAQAEDAYERVSKVHSSGSVADIKMVEVETKLAQAKASEKTARRALDDCIIRAPFAGTVGEVYVNQGEELSVAAPVARIIDMSRVEIHFPLPETEFQGVKSGDKADVEVPALGKTLTAEIVDKGIVASPLSHSYTCTLGKLSDAGGLMPGMVCKIRMQAALSEGIVIPATAVMTDVDGRYVWTVTGGVVAKTYVTIGGYSGTGIIVSGGLSEDMSVIVEGARKVSTGMKVKTVL